MASTYLTRTSTAGNRQKFTTSFWFKLAKADSTRMSFFSAHETTDGNELSYMRVDDKIWIREAHSNTSDLLLETNRFFRDVNAWYHIVFTVDTTQATDTNRVKMYVNGVQETSFANATYPSQNYNTRWNESGNLMQIGRNVSAYTYYFDGSMSHFHHCDGYAYSPSDFGETDATTGEWKIKTNPSVSYGNNGFFILKDGNSVTDQSGNSNNFTVAGGTLTKTEDNPSNVFATLNPLHTTGITGNYFLSLGNLRQNVTDNDGHRETGFTLHPKGLKGYFEVKCTVDPNFHLGLQNVASALGKTNYYTLASSNYYYMQASNPVKISYANGGSSANHIADYFSQISVGDIIGCAFDFTGTNKNVWFHKNGTYGSSGGYVGNPANGTYPAMSSTQLTADEYEFIISPNTGSGNGQLDFNFGNGYFGTTAVSSAGTNASNNGIFEYDVPSGFTALSTKGLNL